MDFTQTWQWPQWVMAILLFLSVFINCARHGSPMVEIAGDQKGQPLRYSGFIALLRFILWVFILSCGGFFA